MRKTTSTMLLFTLLLVAVLHVPSCGGRTATGLDTGSPQTANQPEVAGVQAAANPKAQDIKGWPSLPHDAYVDPTLIRARRGSAVGEIGLPGSNVFMLDQATAQISPEDMTCALTAGSQQLSWVMYQFTDLLPEDLPMIASLRFEGDLPAGPCFVGISNYALGRWDWTGDMLADSGFHLPLAAGQQPVSPGGSMYLLVGAWNGVALAVREAALELDAPAPPPVNFNVDGGNGSDVAVHLSWIDPAVSFDPDGGGPQQYTYDGIEIRRAISPLGPWSSIATLGPGVTFYDDPDTLGAQPGNAGPYYYEIRTLIQSVLSPWGFILKGSIDLALNTLTANLTLAPGWGNPGVSVTLNGASSVHSSTLTTVSWDFDGNGTWDSTTTPSLTTTHVYPTAGRYYPRLKLVMDIGGGSTMTDTVSAYLPVGDARGDWSQFARNSQHQGKGVVDGPSSVHDVKTYASASTIFNEPAIGADGTVLITASDGYLYSLNPDLTFKSKLNLLGPAVCTPAITRDGSIWLHVQGTLFNHDLTCVWPDGTIHKYPVAVMENEPVVSANGFYVYAVMDNAIYCAQAVPPAGSPTWYTWVYTTPIGEGISTPAVAGDGSVYFTTSNYLYKLTINGKLVWKRPLPGISFGTPTVAPDGKIYATYGQAVYAYDSDSNVLWAANDSDGYEISGPVTIASDGSIIACTVHGSVCAFAPIGYFKYPAFNAAGEVFNHPAAIGADGRIYVVAQSGNVFCLTKKLTLSWSYYLGAPGNDGTIALGTNGMVYIGGPGKISGII